MSESMSLRPALRLMPVTRSALDTGSRTIRLSFSSETPTDQWFGREVLSHAPGAADLSRLNDGGPLLWNHDRADIRGVVEHAEIAADRRGYAVVRFARTAAGEEAVGLVRDGIVRGISVSYQIGQMAEERDAEGALYRVTHWVPLEISLAPVAADPTVGVGRAAMPPQRRHLTIERPVEVIRSALSPLAAPAILARSAPQPEGNPMSVATLPTRPALIDLSAAERRSYSIGRAMLELSRTRSQPTGLEFEISAEIARLAGLSSETRSLFVPTSLLANRAVTGIATSGNTTGGGSLIATDLAASDFINALRPVSRVLQLGARSLPNLKKDVDVPRVATGATSAWVTEGDASVEDESVFDKVTLRPHILTGYAQMTREMVVSITAEMEALIRNDIARAIGTGLDAAAIAGSGVAPVPTGILNTSGISTVSLGTNGGPITVTGMDDLEAAVAESNVFDDSFGYIAPPAQIRKLRALVDTANRPIWRSYGDPDGKISRGHWNGIPAVASNNVPRNLTKGTGTNLSAIVFGNWSDMILADWGFVELTPNPYGAGYQSGTIELNALLFADVGVRHPAAFSAIVDAT